MDKQREAALKVLGEELSAYYNDPTQERGRVLLNWLTMTVSAYPDLLA